MKKKVLIYGITGQDGSHLAKIYLNKKFVVHGISRKNKNWNKNLKFFKLSRKIKIFKISKNYKNLIQILKNDYDFIFYLGGPTSVIASYDKFEEETFDSQIVPISIILEFIKNQKKNKSKFMYSSSSEIFGDQKKERLNEESPKYPQSPYALSKLIGFEIVKSYREMFNLPVFSIIFFNHESILRDKNFIFKKVSNYLRKKNYKKKINVGNLNILRDWGYSDEYMNILYKIMQSVKVDDFVLATGKSIKLSEIIKLFFQSQNLNYKKHIKIDKRLFRKFDIKQNYADIKKLKKIIKIYPKKNFNHLIKLFT